MQEHEGEDAIDISKIDDNVQVADLEPKTGNDFDPKYTIPEGKENDPDYSKEEYEKAFANKHIKFNPNGKSSPGEFNRNDSFFRKIDSLKDQNYRETRELKQALKELKDQMTQAEQRGYQKALQDIQQQRLQAVEYGDRAKFEALDKEYAELQSKLQQVPAATVDTELMEFERRNSEWFNYNTAENSVMKDEAYAYQQRFLQDRADKGLPALSRSEVGRKIEEYIKFKYPHRFENPAKSKPAAVEGSRTGKMTATESRPGYKDLSKSQQKACDEYIKINPKNTVDSYIAVLEKAGVRFNQ